MTYMIILGLILLLFLAVATGNTLQKVNFRFSSPKSLHRIELEPGIEPWTLFVPGPKLREWGFIKDGTWVQHEQYLKEKYELEH
jgi:hypothetical protein